MSLKGTKNHLLIFLKGELSKKKKVPIENEVSSCNFRYKFGHWACQTLSLDSAILNIKNNKIKTNKTKQKHPQLRSPLTQGQGKG